MKEAEMTWDELIQLIANMPEDVIVRVRLNEGGDESDEEA